MLAQLQKQEFHQAFSLEKLGFSPWPCMHKSGCICFTVS